MCYSANQLSHLMQASLETHHAIRYWLLSPASKSWAVEAAFGWAGPVCLVMGIVAMERLQFIVRVFLTRSNLERVRCRRTLLRRRRKGRMIGSDLSPCLAAGFADPTAAQDFTAFSPDTQAP